MTDNTSNLKTLEQLLEDNRLQTKHINLAKWVKNTAESINSVDKAGLESSIFSIEKSARDLLPLARELYAREAKCLLDQGIAVTELNTDGVTYLGHSGDEVRSVVLPMTYALTRAVQHTAPQAKMGWWKLDQHGDMVIGGHREDEGFIVCANETFINNAMITEGSVTGNLKVDELGDAEPIRNDREPPEPVVCSLDLILIDSEGYHWRINPGTIAHTGMVFNSSDQLPPVDCPILIKVPADTKVVYAQSPGRYTLGKCTEVDQILPVIRTSHLVTKDRDMAYKLNDGGVIYGRLAWTYP